MALNPECVLMEPKRIILYNDPLLLCAKENMPEECNFAIERLNDDIRNSSIIFDRNAYQIGNGASTKNCPTENDSAKKELPSQTEEELPDTFQNVNMMHYFYTNIPKDQPEFVDVNSLTLSETIACNNLVDESIVLSDDENDVVFVKEYKKEETEDTLSVGDKKTETIVDGIRRNPVRKARINRGKRHLQKEHLLEEDFAVLDQIEEDNLIFNSKQKLSPEQTSSTQLNEHFKEWPINCYERPEYNPESNKIDPSAFKLPKVQKEQQKKKSRIETSPSEKKPKKKYFVRKRKPKAKKVEKKIPVTELKGVVDATLELVRDFTKLLTKDESSGYTMCKDNVYELLKTQIAIVSVVKDYGKNEVTQCVNDILSES